MERNKRFGFNLVDRRVSPRSLAEGVTLTCAKTVTKAPCAKATAPFSSDYTRPGREFNTFQAQKKKMRSCQMLNLTFILFYFSVGLQLSSLKM